MKLLDLTRAFHPYFSFALSFGCSRFLANSSYTGLGLKFEHFKLAWVEMAVDHSIRRPWGESACAGCLKINMKN